MRNILLTGSTGFLGKHLKSYLQKNYPNTNIVESNTKKNNLENYNNLQYWIGDGGHNNIPSKFDYIFHFAAVTKAGDWCLTHQADQWLINQQINTNIIRYWKQFQPQAKFIGIGTSCSYGNDWRRSEENYLTYEPEPSLLTYAYTKRMLYLGLEAMAQQYKMNYLYFVPSTLYGSHFTDNDNHFIYDIIRKTYNAKQNKTDIHMWGDGHQRRELIWVDDFIKIMMNMTSSLFYNNEIINVGSGDSHAIINYYEIIKNLFKCEGKIISEPNKYVGMLDNKLCNSFTYVKNFQFSNLQNNLQELIKYYNALKYE